jgi:aspartyl-tRNA(Asn)/glutamyl-tRNA(Gln) amidotransferase subunit C
MAITEKDVLHVAALSRLSLSTEEAARFTGQLDRIIGFIGTLNEADTSGVEPTAAVAGGRNVLRADTAGKTHPTEEMLTNAPERDKDFFTVPQVIE